MKYVKGIFILLYINLGCTCMFAQFTLQDSLIAHYPLDGDANDISGNNNHGTIIGAVVGTDRFGNPNSSFQFDGVDDYISILPQNKFKPQLPVTISAWIYKDVDKPTSVFRNDYQEDLYSGVWLNVPNIGRVEIAFGGSGSPAPANRRSKLGDTYLEPGQWYHVAGVIRGALDMDVYVNGVNDCGSYGGNGQPLFYTDNPGTIALTDALDGPSSLAYFQGRIDEIRFYNRALSAAEIEVLADYVPPAINVGTNTSICEGEEVQLAVTGGISYNWTPADGLSCTDCSNPIASPANTTTYQVIVGESNCVADTLAVQIEVQNCVDCESLNLLANAVYAISDLSVEADNGGSTGAFDGAIYSWGDGQRDTISSFQTISHTYADPGDYTICMELFGGATLGLDCRDTVCTDIQIEAPCDLQFNPSLNIGNDTTICAGETIQLSVSEGSTFAWTPAVGLSCTDCVDPIASPASSQSYQVIVSDPMACEPDTLTVNIIVEDCIDCTSLGLTAAFTVAQDGLMIDLDNRSSTGTFDGAIYSWGDGQRDTISGFQTISHTYADPGDYTICMELFGGATLGLDCRDTVCTHIQIEAPCDMQFSPSLNTGADTTICAGEAIQLSVSEGSTFAWSPAVGLSCTDCADPIASPASSQSYQVIVSDPMACEPDTLTVNIIVEDCIDCASLGLTAVFSLEQDGFMVRADPNNSNGAFDRAIFNWGDGAIDTLSFLQTIEHTYANAGLYTICLELLGGSNINQDCRDTICTEIQLLGDPCLENIFIPNVFTPNNDGINDIFLIRFACPTLVYDLQIFDRWGRRMYEGIHVEEGWNGKNLQNKEAQEGVYMFMMEVDLNTGIRVRKTGSITLIR